MFFRNRANTLLSQLAWTLSPKKQLWTLSLPATTPSFSSPHRLSLSMVLLYQYALKLLPVHVHLG
jgi:hypothetical protein